jgi:hypothetical protein
MGGPTRTLQVIAQPSKIRPDNNLQGQATGAGAVYADPEIKACTRVAKWTGVSCIG